LESDNGQEVDTVADFRASEEKGMNVQVRKKPWRVKRELRVERVFETKDASRRE